MKTISKIFILISGCSGSVTANSQIAILNFELNDITSLPNTQKERKRTASIKPFLEQELQKIAKVDIIPVSAKKQRESNPGIGYLFRFHDLAAKLGKQHGAEWVIVGQHSKPSFLYSYLIAYVVNVKTEKAIARYDIELKGNHQKVTQRAAKRLAKNIVNAIAE
jgi:hypothetical protein